MNGNFEISSNWTHAILLQSTRKLSQNPIFIFTFAQSIFYLLAQNTDRSIQKGINPKIKQSFEATLKVIIITIHHTNDKYHILDMICTFFNTSFQNNVQTFKNHTNTHISIRILMIIDQFTTIIS